MIRKTHNWEGISDPKERRAARNRSLAYSRYQRMKDNEEYKAEKKTATKVWTAANPARAKSSTKKWVRENRYRAKALWRRGQTRDLLHKDHDVSIEIELYQKACELTEQTGIRHSVDHIIPLALDGWHHHDNMQVLPHSVNSSKHCDPFWEMEGYKSFLDVPEHLWPEKLIPSYLAIKSKHT